MTKLIGAGILISVALFMLLGLSLAETPMTWPVAILTYGVAVGIPAAAAGGLIHLHRQERRQPAGEVPRTLPAIESEVIRLAGRKSGRLTVIEIVGELGVSPEDAQQSLESLMQRGIGDVEITDSGLVVYRFEDVQRLKEKKQSRPILDA